MFGFLTILAFVIAWNAGGWWWLIAIVMGLVWSRKQQQRKESAAPANLPIGESFPGPPVEADRSKARTQSKQVDGAKDWVIELTEICSKYSASDFYVAELIPEQKLKNAMSRYPLPNGGRAVALIDVTLFGAADDGLLIGEHGLSWHNFATESKVSSLHWKDFSTTKLLLDGSKINFGDIGVFDTTGSSLGKGKIIGLLVAIQVSYAYHSKRTKTEMTDVNCAEKITTNVNCAPYEDLLTLPGIGAAEAKMILARRESIPFSSLESLTQYLDLKPHKADRLKNLLTFSTPNRSPDVKTPKSPLTIIKAPNSDVPPSAVSKPVASSGGRMID